MMESAAEIRGQYRYSLLRMWNAGALPTQWVMLNPSTATADANDATIRRCMHLSLGWGDGGIHVWNLFAFRTAYPVELKGAEDPVGPENDAWLDKVRGDVICAWGVLDNWMLPRGQKVCELLIANGCRLLCLGRTKAGFPLHPVRLSRNVMRQTFEFHSSKQRA